MVLKAVKILMLTSISATSFSTNSAANSRVGPAISQPSSVSGFTLLEVLVVVTLLALFASMTLPMMGRNPSGEDLDYQGERLRNTVQILSENSLFRGELLALRVDADTYQPMQYDVTERAFLDMAGDEALAGYTLPSQYLLEWQLADEESSDEQTLAYAANALSEPDTKEEETPSPQIFFFPSGESTPITLLLRDSEQNRELRLIVDPAGRVVIEGDDQSERDEP